MKAAAPLAALLLVLAAPAALAAPVASEPLRGPTLVHGVLSPEEVACPQRDARVQRWTPADGPAAALIADVFVAPRSNEWIGLGYDDRGYWAAEVTTGDACDTCAQLALTRTGFDGSRTVHPVASYDGIEPTTRRDTMAQLFRLAAGPWNVAQLRHDATLRVPRTNAEGEVDGFTGWVVEIQKGAQLLRVAQVNTPFMCWCNPGFRGYTLARPRR